MDWEAVRNVQLLCGFCLQPRKRDPSGFLSLRGGHRAGICGTAVVQNDISLRDISSTVYVFRNILVFHFLLQRMKEAGMEGDYCL